MPALASDRTRSKQGTFEKKYINPADIPQQPQFTMKYSKIITNRIKGVDYLGRLRLHRR